VPNPTVSVFVQNDGFNERVIGLGVAVPIPLPAPVGRTYAGEIAEADALSQRAEIERSRVERELRLEIADATATYTAHRLAVEAMTPERMRRAEDSLRDLQVEIEAGRLGVREALVAQQTLIELLQTNIAQRRALCLASVDLARALGVPLEGGAR
jgi:cobalt-zinc-cadmium efflux system outer membrane protein